MSSNEGVPDEGFKGWMGKMKSRVSGVDELCASLHCSQQVAGAGNCTNRFINGLLIQGPLTFLLFFYLCM